MMMDWTSFKNDLKLIEVQRISTTTLDTNTVKIRLKRRDEVHVVHLPKTDVTSVQFLRMIHILWSSWKDKEPLDAIYCMPNMGLILSSF